MNSSLLNRRSMTLLPSNALKSKGLVSGVGKKILDPMRRVRNDALHADWDNISEMHVGSVISTVEQLILSHFSPS